MSMNPLRTMTVDPKMLLRSSETLAYAFASYAAAENDVSTLQAFLEVGVNPAVATHSVKRRGDDKMVVNPWFKAIENDAIDCVRLIMDWPGTNVSKLMSMHPERLTAMDVALANNARRVLALWRERKIKIKQKGNNRVITEFGLGNSHALGIAAQFGDEETVQWLLSAGANPLLEVNDAYGYRQDPSVVLEHFLAWGDCAQTLNERLKIDPQCAKKCQESFSASSLSCFEVSGGRKKMFTVGGEELRLDLAAYKGDVSFSSYSNNGGLAVIHRSFSDATQSFPAAWCPMSPIACAVVGESAQVLRVFVEHFGQEVVATHAQQTLNFLRAMAPKVRVYAPDGYWEDNQGDSQVQRAINACERWILGGYEAQGRMAPEGGSPNEAEELFGEKVRRRAVRL